MLLYQLDLRPFDDAYPDGSWSRCAFLSEQASPQNPYRQYQKHSVHVHTSKKYSTDRGSNVRPAVSAITGFGSAARIHSFARRTSQRRRALVLAFPPFRGLFYGIGLGPGTGATPQIADAQGGRGGVGISDSLPWVAAEPPLMQTPVKVSLLAYGLVNPSVSVSMKMTIWFSSSSVRPRLPLVISILFGTSGIGQQSTFSVVPGGQCPEVTGYAYLSRVL